MKERIKAVRQHPEVNLSQEAFGKKLGVTGAAISRVESGTRNASEQIILGICREFNVNETWLRTGEGKPFVEVDKDAEFDRICMEIQLSDDKFIKDIMRKYWGLDESGKAIIRQMLAGLADEKK